MKNQWRYQVVSVCIVEDSESFRQRDKFPKNVYFESEHERYDESVKEVIQKEGLMVLNLSCFAF